jgi:DNA-binding transcriptional MerR regulator
MTDHDRLLTITEAAELLRIPVATLRWYRHLGIGPRSFKLGRHVMYREADLFSWVDAQAEAAMRHRAG